MKKKSFEKLSPVLLDKNGETYEIPPDEFARICPVCVKGSRKSVLTQVEMEKLKRENPEAYEAFTSFFIAYEGSKSKKDKEETKPKPPVPYSPEEEAEREKRNKFFAQYEDPQIANLIYSGDAENLDEAQKILEKEKEKKAERERKQFVDMLSYNLNPFVVEVDRPQVVSEATEGRTDNWHEMNEQERKVALKNRKKVTLSLQDYIELCHWNVRPPTLEEISQLAKGDQK